MSDHAAVLGNVLSEIIANRAQLAAQLEIQAQDMAKAHLQVQKFDTLIATLQVATGDTAIQALIDSQAGANAALTEGRSSPTDAAPKTYKSVAAAIADSSSTDDYDALESTDD